MAALFTADHLAHYRNAVLAFCALEPLAQVVLYGYMQTHRRSLNEMPDLPHDGYVFPQLYTILQQHVPQYITQAEVDRCWRRLPRELPDLVDWWNMFRHDNHSFPVRSWAATQTLEWFNSALRPVVMESASSGAAVAPARRRLTLVRKEE